MVKGLKNTPIKDANNQFVPGLDIDLLFHSYWLNLSYANLLLKFSLTVEKHLKASLTKVISNYGVTPTQYLHKRYYRLSHSNVFKKIQNEIDSRPKEFSQVSDDFGTIPSWYLIQAIPFGISIQWYSVLNDAGKTKITSDLLDKRGFHYQKLTSDERKELLKALLNLVLELRNKMAHNGHILNIKIDTVLPFEALTKFGLGKYLDTAATKEFPSNIFNFIVICIALTNLPIQAENIERDFELFFYWNSRVESNPLVELNISALQLFDIDQAQIIKLQTLIHDMYV